MSIVWLAERADGVVKRAVALKMPMFMLQGPEEAVRFSRERDALASLSHAHVARLYDAGLMPSGQPFMALEFVDGMSLTSYCDAQRLDLRARLRLFLQVLAAVEHAHKHLVVHRDLKPSNILVDTEGQVKLLDFGIAKLLDAGDAAGLTQAAGPALTPLYAAPEQLHGAVVSTLTDVYSLGVVLHELLTGSLPYGSVGPDTTLVQILESLRRGSLPRASEARIDEAAARARGCTSASKLRAMISGDLDTIVGKALRITPDERYGSAAHLAEDLKRFLDSRPIQARPPGVWYSLRLAVARHRLAASVAGVGLALVAGASVVAWLQYRESRMHAERTAAVRDFMFDLVNDAEASEGQQGDVTGRQMVAGAVERARRDFGAEPQLQGELLGELGRMYIRLGAADEAVPVLEQSVGILEAKASADDAALNKARVFLADALLQTSEDLPRIRTLAERARDACTIADVECAKARAYAGTMLSQLASFDGDDESALVFMRASAADVERAFGAAHEETAMALRSLAVIARNAGHLAEAAEAMQRAVTISRDLRLRSADRALLESTMAVIDMDLGRYAAARDRLAALQAGPARGDERAETLRLLANVYVELGDAPRALQSAEAAMAALPAENADSELPYVLQAGARASSLGGRHDAALSQIDEVIRRFMQSGRSANSFELLRAERYRAEFMLRAGRGPEALAAARELVTRQKSIPVSPTERGLALDLLGDAERLAGNTDAARQAHEAARTELGRLLPPQHPYLVRNAALMGATTSGGK
jgi:serine/threonine-protein kinase